MIGITFCFFEPQKREQNVNTAFVLLAVVTNVERVDQSSFFVTIAAVVLDEKGSLM